ncbi:DEAD/DEAH box helicase [Ralstonia sp. ASV6]|uniref:DEAD/DEAH box helicase n=1 Tax=Ralstonia sp. ASV6 TaxID=2795124 RepID=UPI0018ECB997|nr:DEAD/DEAH box helicase [Ralstonia sp. ASV6]
MGLRLQSLGFKSAYSADPKPLVQRVVYDGFQFGILFSHFEGANLILKQEPYNGRYIPKEQHPYHRFWRFPAHVLYEHGEALFNALIDAGNGRVKGASPEFFKMLADARADAQPSAFTDDLTATIYQIEAGGAVLVSSAYHPAVVSLAQSMKGRYLAPMRAWKLAQSSPHMVRENLIEQLKLREDQVTIAQGIFDIVDDAFVPQGNKGATIQVLPSAIPEFAQASEDHDKEVYLAVTAPLAPTPLTSSLIEAAIAGYSLYDYQKVGVRHLVRNSSALLADDMGLGKTRQGICAADILSSQAPGKQILVITLSDLMINWAREIAQVLPGETSISLGYRADKRWIVINYEMLHTVAHLADRFVVMVVDEAHSIKDPTALRTRYAFDIAASVPYRVILTGTPILNRESEIHTLLRLSGHPLGKIPLKTFQEKFAGDAAFRRDLGKLIREWMLYRTKDQVLKHLKGKRRQARYIELDQSQRERYDAINADSGIITLAKITKLRQELEISKVRAVVDMVSQLNGDDKVLVFCEFSESVAHFEAALRDAGHDPCVLTGAIKSKKRRQAVIDEFQTNPLKRVLVATRSVGGVGHNITAANYVILVSLPWTPFLAKQAEDRAYRNGQERLVFVLIVLVDGTIDIDVVEMHKSKMAIATEILDPEEAERLAMMEFAEGFDRKAA